MTLKIDGQRFGRLQTIRKIGSVDRKVVWLFRCDCGNEVELPATRVTGGHTQSCGCMRIEAARESVLRDVLGMRFGRLLVLERLGSSGGRVQWRCVCDCGTEVTRSAKNLVNGTATSCGCRKREAGIENVRSREVDLTGHRFGKLVVVSEAGRPKPGVKLYRCACDCGGERVSRHGDLQNGKVISCGCATNDDAVYMTDEARNKGAANCAARRARKSNAGGSFTAEQVEALSVKQRHRCANCGDLFKNVGMARDHRTALANGGSNDISNMELLCPPCNQRKHAKDEIAWARENDRLI